MSNLGAQARGFSSNGFPVAKNDVVWLSRIYNPREPRTTSIVPVPKEKYNYPKPGNIPEVPEEWRLQAEPPIYSYSRWAEDKHYPSSQATRCEKWSTLRQSLPSRDRRSTIEGFSRWGTGHMFCTSHLPLQKSSLELKPPGRFPHVNSQMTRYVNYVFATYFITSVNVLVYTFLHN
eukprot:gene19967-21922_t